jgi:membrane protein implicated in regulation of membrane protease activity
MSFLEPGNSFWIWLIAAGVMLAVELALPGVFFLWLALAAATVGLVTYLWPLDWLASLPLFAVLALAYVYFGRPFYGRKSASDQPNLNQRHYNYVGRTYVLAEPMRDGRGKLTIEDTVWDVTGPDLAAGTPVKIVGIEGLSLRVAAA